MTKVRSNDFYGEMTKVRSNGFYGEMTKVRLFPITVEMTNGATTLGLEDMLPFRAALCQNQTDSATWSCSSISKHWDLNESRCKKFQSMPMWDLVKSTANGYSINNSVPGFSGISLWLWPVDEHLRSYIPGYPVCPLTICQTTEARKNCASFLRREFEE